MKKNLAKTLAIAGMAVLTMGALAGCGSSSAAKNDTTTPEMCIRDSPPSQVHRFRLHASCPTGTV